jgi:group I intron endonuclease
MKHIVYKTTNNINKKYYIGVHSTENIYDEYLGCGHWRGRKINTNTKSPILNAFLKYGDENFTKEILFIFEDRKDALLKEQEFINITDKNCYNAREGGDNGYVYTVEAKAKMSESAKERSKKFLLQTNLLSENAKKRKGKTYREIYGEERAKEVNLKRIKSLTGRKLTDEHKRKMSENRKGKDCGMCKGKKQVWNTLTNKTIRLSESELHTEIERGVVIEKEFIKDKFHKFKFVKIK